jgi:molybdate transport repressor ModE-like protein
MTITHISLAQIRVLTEIAQTGSFSAAAQSIGMTQSGASHAIKKLEEALGVKLLMRMRDRVVPTEIGLSVLADAREVILAIERIRQTCAAGTGVHTGRVRIGSVVSAASRVLPRRLAEYRRRYPDVAVTLMEGTDQEVCEWVERAVVDIGLTAETSAGTEGIVVAEDAFRLVVAQGHALARKKSIDLAEVAKEPFLMSGSGCEPAIRRIFARARIDPIVAGHVRDTGALIKMVGEGLGITLMPELSLPEREQSISVVDIHPAARRQVLALTRKNQELMPAVGKLVQVLAR